MATQEQIALYEQVSLCRFDDEEAAMQIKADLEPLIPDEIKEQIGSFEGSPYEYLDVVQVKTIDVLPELIQAKSLVTLKACLRHMDRSRLWFVVENAEGKECLLSELEVGSV